MSRAKQNSSLADKGLSTAPTSTTKLARPRIGELVYGLIALAT